MQFKNPEILYLLFLLIIPILIHLFQLQKFQKVAFTNVKILKAIEQQTRKSAKLKKLLILLSRLLIFTSLIIAFAQPFLNKEQNGLHKETIIYLDNSFSMQAKGENGALFQKAKIDLIDNLPNNNYKITLITNDQIIKFQDFDQLKQELIYLDYYPIKKDLNSVLLQVQNLKKKKEKILYEVLLISDFQINNENTEELTLDSLTTYSFVQTLPNKFENIAIDSVWVNNIDKDNIKINAQIKSYQLAVKNLSVSLYIDDKLYGKTTLNLDKDKLEIIEFSIANKKNIHGYLSINDNHLKFDNTLYFSIPNKEKTNILAIGEKAEFLSKIYTNEEFNFNSSPLESLNYSLINQQQVIVLNGNDFLPNSLINSLDYYINNGGNLVVIPAVEIDIDSYNQLFSTLQIGRIKSQNNTKKSISIINYDHPFFKGVFQKPITNFQYPSVNSFFDTQFKSASVLLQLEDKREFISEIKWNNSKIYWIAASLTTDNSNFINSPLVVPIFYNFSLQNTSQKTLFYTIGEKNEFIIKFNSNNDEVLHMVKSKQDFIPLQSKTTNYTKIQTDNNPITDGIYQIKNQSETLQNVAFNYNRKESDLNFTNIYKKYKNIQYFKSLNKALSDMNDKNKNRNLWQLFIIFALLFVGIEILFQKFLK